MPNQLQNCTLAGCRQQNKGDWGDRMHVLLGHAGKHYREVKELVRRKEREAAAQVSRNPVRARVQLGLLPYTTICDGLMIPTTNENYSFNDFVRDIRRQNREFVVPQECYLVLQHTVNGEAVGQYVKIRRENWPLLVTKLLFNAKEDRAVRRGVQIAFIEGAMPADA